MNKEYEREMSNEEYGYGFDMLALGLLQGLRNPNDERPSKPKPKPQPKPQPGK